MTSDAPILAASAAGREQADPRRWAALIVLLLAAFMSLLDVSIVNIAIPSIQRGLHASYADVQWALVGYTLAYAIVLITGGRLGDMFGRKRLFLIGVAGFTAMSALCGAAQGPAMLIACRVVQGAMGAIMIPQVLAVIQVSFPPGERIKALAGYGATAGLGTVSGPLIGGLLVTHNVLGLGWRTGVRGAEHRLPDRQLHRPGPDRRHLLRAARQPIRPGRERDRSADQGRPGRGQRARGGAAAHRRPVPRLPA
jgi:sugar phosphate permease